MMTMAETIPGRVPAAGPLQRRYRLPTGLAAVAEARERVRAAIRDWELPVNGDVAVLATWDLVTSLITEEPGGADGTEIPAGPAEHERAQRARTPGTVTLGISGTHGRLRVDAYDGRGYRWGTPGLAIVASLADDWGRYRTPGGRAAYFTLLFVTPLAPEPLLAPPVLPDTSVD
jgi:hypothetical protein